MTFRITIQVTCDSVDDAQDAISRLTRPRTWVDDVEARHRKEASAQALVAAEPVVEVKTARANVDPGKSSISKIGADTKATLLADLAHDGSQPVAKYAEHMKLLWARNEVKFDGEEYYL